jgi:5-methylcytosine-specific restriction endonuclease McrA
MGSERTLVLNSGYEVVGIVPWQRAVTLIYEGDAETIHDFDKASDTLKLAAYDKEVSNQSRTYVYPLPAIIRLLKSNVFPKQKKIKFSKVNVLYRDDFTCQYCGFKGEHNVGIKSKKMTIDHVIPVSKGGRTSFENCVAACGDCNSKKGNDMLHESGMKLLKKPVIPTVNILMKRKLSKRHVHHSWEKFLNASPIMV